MNYYELGMSYQLMAIIHQSDSMIFQGMRPTNQIISLQPFRALSALFDFGGTKKLCRHLAAAEVDDP
jgi:hypothetical protein